MTVERVLRIHSVLLLDKRYTTCRGVRISSTVDNSLVNMVWYSIQALGGGTVPRRSADRIPAVAVPHASAPPPAILTLT